MQDYVRLSDASSPNTSRVLAASLDHSGTNGQQYPSDSEDEDQFPSKQSESWWQRLTRSTPISPQSGYLTLVPLSDERLKPRRTKLLISFLLMGTLALVCAVYFLVARGVTVGTILVHSSQMSFNSSKSTYQIILAATLPIYNPNYFPVRVSGTINVSFYDQQAGSTIIAPVYIAAQALPQIMTVEMDASSVPQKYLFTIYSQCFTFPEKLIFFLKSKLQAEYLGSVYDLPLIDSCTTQRTSARSESILGYLLKEIDAATGQPITGCAGPLQFLDVCCAPGGFCEYTLDSCPTSCGLGFSLNPELGGHTPDIPHDTPRFHLQFADTTAVARGLRCRDMTSGAVQPRDAYRMDAGPGDAPTRVNDLIILDGSFLGGKKWIVKETDLPDEDNPAFNRYKGASESHLALLVAQLVVMGNNLKAGGTMLLRLSITTDPFV
ncbi:MAG: hypothetical protein WDW36_002332 [Sanguina aurantia]